MSRKLSVVHIINSFQFGGAERMLCNLLLHTDLDRFEPSVVSLIDDMTVAAPIIDAGIPITVVGMRPGIPDPRGIARLARHLWRLRPAVIQTWMDHSNLIGGLAASLVSRAPLVWGIHHSNHIPSLTKKSTLATVWACKKFSRRVPTRIVCCSEHARNMYAQRGFADEKLMVIPNGFDISAFRPDESARARLRHELDVHPQTPLVGLIARYDPFKDHETFLRGAAKLVRTRPDAHFVLCGHNVDSSNAALMSMIGSLGISEHCHLMGARTDVPRVLAGLDLTAQSSISEAFPLVLGESMACGVPCVSTDVGDSALIIGDTGKIVPPKDPDALAAGMGEMLALRPGVLREIGIRARKRVREMFDLESVTRRYESLYTDLAGPAGRAASVAMPSRKVVAAS